MKKELLCVLAALSLTGPAFGEQKSGTSAPAKEAAAKEPAAKEASAQGATDTKMEILRQKIKTDKKYIVSENMNLTEAEAKGFWPIYEGYQKDLGKINQRIEGLAKTYLEADAQGPVSNQLSKKLVSDWLDIEKSELDAKRAVFGKLGKALPAYKVAKYVQMENKIRAIVKYELAANIPLVE
jgi:hypothetical protein